MADIKDLQQDIKKEQYKSLLIENIKYRTFLTKKYQDKKPYTPKDIKKITAFIPGTITNIYIAPKKKVKAGDKLLVLEAMKMRNDIISPIDGTIKGVFVKEGEKVTKEKILIEFN
jgi:biotin carboxyl carrier protein